MGTTNDKQLNIVALRGYRDNIIRLLEEHRQHMINTIDPAIVSIYADYASSCQQALYTIDVACSILGIDLNEETNNNE